MEEEIAKRVCIVVLADIARSPRMQYHALALAKEGYLVDLVGYGECTPSNALLTNRRITVHYLNTPLTFFKSLPFFLGYICKALWQSITLFVAMMFLRRPQYVLVQTPPAIPTLPVVWFYTVLFGCFYVVDWHNYAHSMISLTLKSKNGTVVKLTRWIERKFGGKGNTHICVTEAMARDMEKTLEVEGAIVLYDKPHETFKTISVEEKHELFTRLAKEYGEFADHESGDSKRTRFTEVTPDGKVQLRSDRPAILISSTSWTEDEDFDILIKALQEYDNAPEGTNLPSVFCIITGRGPKRNVYARRIEKITWNKIDFSLLWVSAEDYPRILACADLGVSLHTSASGFDLPMKVVDMFGCELPVCAVNFNCIGELVKHEENGLVFNSSDELAEQLKTLFTSFPKSSPLLDKFRNNLKTEKSSNWEENWRENILPSFEN